MDEIGYIRDAEPIHNGRYFQRFISRAFLIETGRWGYSGHERQMPSRGMSHDHDAICIEVILFCIANHPS